MKPKIAPEARFWQKVNKNGLNGCWVWTAGKMWAGYGAFGLTHNKTVYAHRFAFELIRGEIPPGLTLDHLCRNRACVNPAHLEIVTLKENILRGEAISAQEARQTYCIHGHILAGSNLAIWPSRPSRRICMECHRIRQRKYIHKLARPKV